MTAPVVLLKTHVSAYRREDGTPVAAHERGGPSVKIGWPHRAAERALAASPAKVVAAAEKPNAFQMKYAVGGSGPGSKSKYMPQNVIGAQYGGKPWNTKPGVQTSMFSKPWKHEEPKAWHPKTDDDGEKVGIHNPHQPSSAAAWTDHEATATVVAGGSAPAMLNDVPFEPWADAPKDLEAWAEVDGQFEFDEPPFECPEKLHPAAGVVIQEPDGRVWLVSPTNGFGGYRNTFPKGRVEDGLSLQASAIKEAFEEAGLKVEITGHLGDFARTQTFTRYYTARRVGGSPAEMGWESQAVRLAPPGALHLLLNGSADHPVREALTA